MERLTDKGRGQHRGRGIHACLQSVHACSQSATPTGTTPWLCTIALAGSWILVLLRFPIPGFGLGFMYIIISSITGQK